MTKRNTDDTSVQSVVSTVHYGSQEVLLLELTKNWNDADFLYAIERLDIKQPMAQRLELRELYQKLRRDRNAFAARIAMEEANARRHDEISRRLEDLKTPHWSVVPNFWMTVVILLLTAIRVILALRH